jgi:two-component system chemotaxis sensor kinase CheA
LRSRRLDKNFIQSFPKRNPGEKPMSIDMSQFYQVFFDEAAEHLVSMEALLLGLNLDAPDADQLNAIFRAAHSIKGGSGTFGFTDMADVTHVLETLLDRVRKNEILLTHDMVDTFLQAGDVLRGLLEAHQRGTVADEARSIAICVKLEQLADNSSVDTGHRTKTKDQAAPMSGSSSTSEQHTYQIQFAITRTAFPSDTHLKNLLEELSNIGTISDQNISTDTVRMTLVTQTSVEKLREIFAFFLEPQQLIITELGNAHDRSAEQSYGFFADPDTIKSGVERAEGYGFFADPDTIKSGVEKAEGYGFFADPDTIKSGVERAEGYGFFTAPEAIKAGVENAQGYGFFNEVENQTTAPAPLTIERLDQNPGRRATDRAAAIAGGESSIRVSVGKVDNLVNLVGELVITQAMLAETVSNMDAVLHERLVNGLGQLERNTRDLQESVMSVRMIPISLVFSRFQRVVRDSAIKLNKKVQLKVIGEGTELDKGLIEKISDPLTHLVRNSLDHGIESPDERIAKGKDPQGTITLRAAHQGGSIVIEVSDDGAGLNRERILAKAREKGMPVNDIMSDADVWQIIFAPGFSTAAVVTDVSGRGVGMDVVKKNIESISGRIDIASENGHGSSMTIRLPLTLAILDGLSIAVGDQIYIVPLGFISESLQPGSGDIKEISGQGEVLHVRGEYLPLIALHKLFNIQPKITDPAEGILVLLEAEGKKVALFVDELVGQHQVVIKSLETNYRKVPGVSGATIMGDGRVAMIIDVGALVKLAQQGL